MFRSTAQLRPATWCCGTSKCDQTVRQPTPRPRRRLSRDAPAVPWCTRHARPRTHGPIRPVQLAGAPASGRGKGSSHNPTTSSRNCRGSPAQWANAPAGCTRHLPFQRGAAHWHGRVDPRHRCGWHRRASFDRARRRAQRRSRSLWHPIAGIKCRADAAQYSRRRRDGAGLRRMRHSS